MHQSCKKDSWKSPNHIMQWNDMEAILSRLVRQLENLARQNVSIGRGLDILEDQSRNLAELIVINVLRDAFHETLNEELQLAA